MTAVRKKNLSKEYLDYMNSPIWKELRDTVIERDDFRCTKCGHKENLQAHHLTYARLFDEKLEDLVTLCKLCHEEAHGVRKPGQRIYIEIAKGVLVLKGEKPSAKQVSQAKQINAKQKKRASWNHKIRAKSKRGKRKAKGYYD